MKAKLISLGLSITLITALIVPLILTGCANDQPNFGATGAKEYQLTLSEMTDQAIRDRIDELYSKMEFTSAVSEREYFDSEIAEIIQVYQNELLLRQLEGRTITNTEKQGLEGLDKKQGLKSSDRKQGLKGTVKCPCGDPLIYQTPSGYAFFEKELEVRSRAIQLFWEITGECPTEVYTGIKGVHCTIAGCEFTIWHIAIISTEGYELHYDPTLPHYLELRSSPTFQSIKGVFIHDNAEWEDAKEIY